MRMLDEPVATKMHLEKPVESKQSKDENRSMDVAAEFNLQRLLEAENTAQVFMEVTRELNSRLEILQFRLNDSLQREAELKPELQALVEENLKDSKIAELTEMNMVLTEELVFLKASEMNSEKISLLEKQVRDLEKEVQVSMASSEAGKKQQDLLYVAIWDMETLIEDLKSKVFKTEMRSERAEDQCLVLAESNSELNKQISFLKAKCESLEASLKEVNREKGQRVKDINDGAKIVADMILKLAVERERIQKQVSSLARENNILMAELQRARRRCFESTNGDKVDSSKKPCFLANGFCGSGKNPSSNNQKPCVKVSSG